jgi:acetyltransferase-like isoleucine patch superfamily enzyme
MMVLGHLPGRRLRTWLARHVLGLRIHPKAVLHQWRDLRSPGKIEIGEDSVIGFWATIDGREGVRIGKHVNLSSEVALWTLQHDPDDRGFGARGGPIEIDDYAWVSFRATVLPGVRIGRGAVVAANAVVTKDVEDYAIVGGTPATVIGRRSKDLDYKLGVRIPWFI